MKYGKKEYKKEAPKPAPKAEPKKEFASKEEFDALKAKFEKAVAILASGNTDQEAFKSL